MRNVGAWGIQRVARKKIIHLACVFCVGFVINSFAVADTVTLRADHWPPYNGHATEPRPGYMIDIAEEIWNNSGFRVDYATVPWERAITDTRSGATDCVVGALPSEVPDFIFHTLPLGVDQSAFYVRNDSDWSYAGRASLDGIRLGVIGGYSYDQGEIDRRIDQAHTDDIASGEIQIMKGDNALEKNFQKLLSGRIDAVVASVTVAAYTINQMELDDKIAFAGSIGIADPLFIACSPSSPKRSRKLVTLLDQGIVKLRASGRLDKIMHQYGLSDWALPLKE